ncbi:DUF4153 domain-containing protein [Zhaonella formicivorans]|uniref:DUF4153 domain-containing protein n=1 Tax=Zhaonella formicivorans TaxID=2528593 RepID=UPI0010D4B713|nr:DUF4153 domain-containing protein [Zhaonella formicivorans]
MGLKIVALGKDVLHKLAASLKRFPEAVLLAAAATVILIAMNHINFMQSGLEEILGRVVMALALGIPLSLCLKMLFERARNIKLGVKLLVYGIAAAVPVLYYFYLLPDLGMVPVTRYISLTLALYCVFTFIPYFDGKPGYEQYVVALIRQFLITALYAVVLFLGLAAMVFTIDRLLFNLPEKLYLDLWLIVVGLFAPAFLLSEVPAYGTDLSDTDYSKVLKALLFYIVMPIIAAYTVILYLYFAKILITRQWPVGMVSHLVLWYALLSTFVMFIIYPLRPANQWVRSFLSFVPKIILPLLVMMFVAMGIRINAYGITENRYLVVAAGIWVTCSMLYFLFCKEKKNVYLAFFLAAVAILTVLGPWSSYSVSKYSQNARFERLLQKNQMLQNGAITPAPQTISEVDKNDIRSIILYFDRYHGLEELKYLPEDFTIENMKNTFGFEMDYNVGGEQYFSYHVQNDNMLIAIGSYEYFYNAGFGKRSDSSLLKSSPLEVSYNREDKRLKIAEQGKVIYDKNIDDVALKIHSRNKGKTNLSHSDMSFTDENESLQVLYVFKYLSGREESSTGKVNIDPPEFYIFIKVK